MGQECRDIAAERLFEERPPFTANAVRAGDGGPIDVRGPVDVVRQGPFSTSRARSVRIVLWFQSWVSRSDLMTSPAAHEAVGPDLLRDVPFRIRDLQAAGHRGGLLDGDDWPTTVAIVDCKCGH